MPLGMAQNADLIGNGAGVTWYNLPEIGSVRAGALDIENPEFPSDE